MAAVVDTSQAASPLAEATATGPARAAFRHDIHLFRGVAICLIVILHSLPSFDWSTRPIAYEVLQAFLEQSSMLFFFISGYLFQHLSGRFDYRRYLGQKWRTIIIPYLVVSIPALIVSTGYIRQTGLWPWFYDLPVWQQIGLFLLTGKHLEPLWFVPTIALYYLASPLFIRIDRTRGLYWLLPVLVLDAAFIGPNGPTGPLQRALYLLPAYMFGMWTSHYREQVLAFTRRYIWAFAAAIALLFATAAAVDRVASPIDIELFFKLLSCPVLILTFERFGSRLPKGLGAIATLSFGIYFVHGYLIAGFRLIYTMAAGQHWSGESGLFAPSLIALAVHAAVVLAASVALIRLVQRLFPNHSKYLIGA